jgi:hypothetical protein
MLGYRATARGHTVASGEIADSHSRQPGGWPCVRLIVPRHAGSEGASPEGWLPDRVSVGALTKAFPPELGDEVVDATDTLELRRLLLPPRLVVVYFVLALWLFRGRNVVAVSGLQLWLRAGDGQAGRCAVSPAAGRAAARRRARPGRLGRRYFGRP